MIKTKWLSSILAATISVVLLQFFIDPVYTSDDDVWYMLTLSGGFSSAPNNLLHVLYGWHPIYGWLVKTLFINFPQVNWYTVFLLWFHVAGLSAVYFYLQQWLHPIGSLVIYLILFAVFETNFLQTPDFTGAALISSVGGCLLLSLRSGKRKYLYIGSIYLLGSMLLRFHISALVIILFAPLIFLPAFFKGLRNLAGLIAVGICWFLLHFFQTAFYKQHVPGWEDRARLRDAFFYLANHPADKQKQFQILDSRPKLQMIQQGFIYDSSNFNAAVWQKIATETSDYRNPFHADQHAALYWIFVNNRIYLSVIFLTALLLFFTNRKIFFERILYLLLPLAIWLYFMVFLKGTNAIHFAFFISAFFYLADGLSAEALTQWWFTKWYVAGCTAFLLFWCGVLTVKHNRLSNEQSRLFYCMAKLLQKNNETFFVGANYDVAIKYFPAWQPPAKYKFDNLLYYQRELTEGYQTILRRQGIQDSFPSWLLHRHLRIIGGPAEVLPEYCLAHYSMAVKIKEDSLSNCLKVYRVLPAERK